MEQVLSVFGAEDHLTIIKNLFKIK
jgi:hypothetical protein